MLYASPISFRNSQAQLDESSHQPLAYETKKKIENANGIANTLGSFSSEIANILGSPANGIANTLGTPLVEEPRLSNWFGPNVTPLYLDPLPWPM